MENEKEQCGIKTQVTTKEPDDYDVIFLKDDFTTMDFVVEILKKVFYHNDTIATSIMMTIHKKGSCVVGTYNLDIAQSKQQKAIEMAQKAGYPLRIKIQPHKD
jgi:ATP-dependent Clp protease adaptor protein ClpS